MNDLVTYRINAPLDDTALNALFASAWPSHTPRDFAPILARSLATITAWDGEYLVGFLNLATDGGEHAFLLDPTVAPDYRRRGIGLALVQHAVGVARARDCHWLHVDFTPELAPFYRAAGFAATAAGLIRLASGSEAPSPSDRTVIDGQAYCLVLGSDLERDGMFLELFGGPTPDGHPLAECFYSDRDRGLSLETYDAVPAAALAWLRREGARRLPPSHGTA